MRPNLPRAFRRLSHNYHYNSLVYRSIAAGSTTTNVATSPLGNYEKLIIEGRLTRDEQQKDVIVALDRIYKHLTQMKIEQPNSDNKTIGLYVHSSPGRGKTMLADMLDNKGVTRMHFIDFMSKTHSFLHKLRTTTSLTHKERIAEVSKSLVPTPALFLDELEVTDIADSSLLQSLLQEFTNTRKILILTSNRSPENLYKGGLNVETFQPAFGIAVRNHCQVFHLDGDTDYRNVNPLNISTSSITPLFTKASTSSVWEQLVSPNDIIEKNTAIAVNEHVSRTINIPVKANRTCIFQFSAIAGTNSLMSGQCYLAIAREFDVVILSNIPVLEARDDLRRCTLLVDVLYEKKKVLICVEASAQFHDVFGFEVENGQNNLDQEFSQVSSGLTVLDEGGSSGRLTTMVSKDLEWSATGLQGASLMDLTSGRFSEVAFSRCKSRLKEMMRIDWLDKADVTEETKSRVKSALMK